VGLAWLSRLLADADAAPVLTHRPGKDPWPLPDGPLRYLRLLGDRDATPAIGTPLRDLRTDFDRWAARRSQAPTGRRLGQPTPDPRTRWPATPLPGLEL
jgi:hypothetical protein